MTQVLHGESALLRKLGLFVVDDFLPSELRAELIEGALASTPADAMVVDDQGAVVDRSARRTSEYTLTDAAAGKVNERLRALRPALADWIGRPLGRFTQPVLLRYGVGDYFRPHADVGADPDDDVRLVSISMFVNGHDDAANGSAGAFSGGDLVFHELFSSAAQASQTVVSVPALPGRLVAFPSPWLHAVQPVVAGTRFSLVAWFLRPAATAVT